MFGPPSRQQTLIGVATATRFAANVLMGTALAVYVSDAGGSPFAVSLLFTAFYLGMMVFAPAWGAVADVTRRRRAVLLLTGGLATLAVLPLAVVRGPWAPIGLRFVYAVFAAGFGPVMLAVVSERGGEEGRGRSLGAYNSVRASGVSAGQVGAGVLLGLVAPAALFGVVAGASLVSTLLVVSLADGAGETRWPGLRAVLGAVRSRLLPAPEDRGHLRTAGLGWLYVSLALRHMTVLGVLSLMPVYLTGPVGLSDPVMGLLMGLNPAAQMAFMYAFGRLADGAGRKPLVVAGLAGSAGYGIVAAAALLPGAEGGRVAVSAAAFLLLAASFSAMKTGGLAFIGDVAPAERQSELMGLWTTAKGVGGVAGPPVFGLVATVLDYPTAFVLGTALAVGGVAIAWLRLAETRPAATAAAGD